MSENQAALRAKRRRDRILMNSEDRMKKIFGGENYHENHLTIVENEGGAVGENEISESEAYTPKPPLLGSRFTDHSSASTQKLKLETNELTALGKAEISVVFWFILGCSIKLLDAASYSWTFANSAFLPYIVSFVTLAFFSNESRVQNSAGVIEIVAQLAGIDPNQISTLKRIFKTVMNFNKTFCSYFLGFLTVEVMIQFLF